MSSYLHKDVMSLAENLMRVSGWCNQQTQCSNPHVTKNNIRKFDVGRGGGGEYVRQSSVGLFSN